MKLSTSLIAVLGFVLIFIAGPLAADDGTLSPELTKRLRQSVKLDRSSKALHNALTNNEDLKALALNRDVVRAHDEVFSHKIKTKKITNQRASGRCWMFAALNVLRPAVIEKHNLKDFQFSESHLAFWDKLEKANCFLEDMIEMRDREPFDREMDFLLKDPINDGGYWEYLTALIRKYGVVPRSVMPETALSQNTAVMNGVLERVLRIDAAKLRAMAAEKKSVEELRKAKKRMLAEIYRILVLNYGEPPAEFTYRFVDKDDKVGEEKKYTPLSFFDECVGVDLDQFVTLAHDPTHPYNKHYKLRRIRNVLGTPEFHYVNIPLEDLKAIALKCVLSDETVWFGADVTSDMDRADGIMQVDLFDFGSIYGVDLRQSKKDRFLTRGGVPNHAMTLVGVDVRGDKPVKWLVENSWGEERGNKGFWTMYDEWFDQHVYSLIVRRAYVPNEILKLLKEDPVELPPWAPMFALPQ